LLNKYRNIEIQKYQSAFGRKFRDPIKVNLNYLAKKQDRENQEEMSAVFSRQNSSVSA